MATVNLGTFNFDGAEIVFEADYNANNRRLQTGRCINNGTQAAHIKLYEMGTFTLFVEATFQPGVSTFNVSNQQVVVQPDGYVDVPFDIEMYYPWPGA